MDKIGFDHNLYIQTQSTHIRQRIEQFGGKLTGKLGFFDTDVKEPLPFESVDDLINIIPLFDKFLRMNSILT